MYALHAPLWQGMARNTSDQPRGTPFSSVRAGVCAFDKSLGAAFYAAVARAGGALPTAAAYDAFAERVLAGGAQYSPDTFLQETGWPGCLFP